jgi:SAM-dependent methyltransferase
VADLREIDIRNRDHLETLGPERAMRRQIECHAAEKFLQDRDESHFDGLCLVCERTTQFLVDWRHGAKPTPNWRERLVCSGCGLNNRQRYALQLLVRVSGGLAGEGRIYLQEQVTPFYAKTCSLLGSERVVGSEYLGPERRPGEVVDGLRHEDAEHLSFSDAGFAAIASNDVLEHVNQPIAALGELCRVLLPGGVALITIPFHEGRETTRRRARIESDGTLIHLETPEYHGNPMDHGGSLVFSDFGWDFLDLARQAGFSDAFVRGYWSLLNGHLGGGLQLLFVLRK